MKTRTFCLAVVIGLLGALPMRPAEAGTSFALGISISNVNDFYEPLGAYGTWVEVADYGRCWRPAYVGGDWQPYATGHWEWTDQGWYWVSDEPWAWAAYHYGRWVWDPYYGWVWVPDTVWGPSWVAWREGGGYYGWAPLPPVRYCGTGGLVMWERVSWCSRAFVFVEFGRFCEPVHYRHHYHRGWHHPAFQQTINITNVRVINNNTHIHHGPRVETVRQHTGHQLRPGNASEIWRHRSDQVVQRASLDRAAVPPVVSRPSGGATERPQRGASTSLAPQPSQQRETEHRGNAPRPQPQQQPGRSGITTGYPRTEPNRSTVTAPVTEPRRTEPSRTPVVTPPAERGRQGPPWQQRTDSRRETAAPQPLTPRYQPASPSRPAPQQEARVTREVPRETRTYTAPPQREQRSSDSGRSGADRNERSGSYGSSDSRGGGGFSGTPPWGGRMGERGGRR
jgi:hypothetical protein